MLTSVLGTSLPHSARAHPTHARTIALHSREEASIWKFVHLHFTRESSSPCLTLTFNHRDLSTSYIHAFATRELQRSRGSCAWFATQNTDLKSVQIVYDCDYPEVTSVWSSHYSVPRTKTASSARSTVSNNRIRVPLRSPFCVCATLLHRSRSSCTKLSGTHRRISASQLRIIRTMIQYLRLYISGEPAKFGNLRRNIFRTRVTRFLIW